MSLEFGTNVNVNSGLVFGNNNLLPGDSLSPPTATLTLTGHAPTLLATTPVSAELQPAAAIHSFSSDAWTLTASDESSLQPIAGNLTFAGHAPALTTEYLLEPVRGTATIEGRAPTLTTELRQSITLFPGRAKIAFSTPAPTLLVAAKTLRPSAAQLRITGHAPQSFLADQPLELFPQHKRFLFSTGAPVLAAESIRLTPVSGSFAFNGQTPTIALSLPWERLDLVVGTSGWTRVDLT